MASIELPSDAIELPDDAVEVSALALPDDAIELPADAVDAEALPELPNVGVDESVLGSPGDFKFDPATMSREQLVEGLRGIGTPEHLIDSEVEAMMAAPSNDRLEQAAQETQQRRQKQFSEAADTAFGMAKGIGAAAFGPGNPNYVPIGEPQQVIKDALAQGPLPEPAPKPHVAAMGAGGIHGREFAGADVTGGMALGARAFQEGVGKPAIQGLLIPAEAYTKYPKEPSETDAQWRERLTRLTMEASSANSPVATQLLGRAASTLAGADFLEKNVGQDQAAIVSSQMPGQYDLPLLGKGNLPETAASMGGDPLLTAGFLSNKLFGALTKLQKFPMLTRVLQGTYEGTVGGAAQSLYDPNITAGEGLLFGAAMGTGFGGLGAGGAKGIQLSAPHVSKLFDELSALKQHAAELGSLYRLKSYVDLTNPSMSKLEVENGQLVMRLFKVGQDAIEEASFPIRGEQDIKALGLWTKQHNIAVDVGFSGEAMRHLEAQGLSYDEIREVMGRGPEVDPNEPIHRAFADALSNKDIEAVGPREHPSKKKLIGMQYRAKTPEGKAVLSRLVDTDPGGIVDVDDLARHDREWGITDEKVAADKAAEKAARERAVGPEEATKNERPGADKTPVMGKEEPLEPTFVPQKKPYQKPGSFELKAEGPELPAMMEMERAETPSRIFKAGQRLAAEGVPDAKPPKTKKLPPEPKNPDVAIEDAAKPKASVVTQQPDGSIKVKADPTAERKIEVQNLRGSKGALLKTITEPDGRVSYLVVEANGRHRPAKVDEIPKPRAKKESVTGKVTGEPVSQGPFTRIMRAKNADKVWEAGRELAEKGEAKHGIEPASATPKSGDAPTTGARESTPPKGNSANKVESTAPAPKIHSPLLAAAAELQAKLGRVPTPDEVAKNLNVTKKAAQNIVTALGNGTPIPAAPAAPPAAPPAAAGGGAPPKPPAPPSGPPPFAPTPPGGAPKPQQPPMPTPPPTFQLLQAQRAGQLAVQLKRPGVVKSTVLKAAALALGGHHYGASNLRYARRRLKALANTSALAEEGFRAIERRLPRNQRGELLAGDFAKDLQQLIDTRQVGVGMNAGAPLDVHAIDAAMAMKYPAAWAAVKDLVLPMRLLMERNSVELAQRFGKNPTTQDAVNKLRDQGLWDAYSAKLYWAHIFKKDWVKLLKQHHPQKLRNAADYLYSELQDYLVRNVNKLSAKELAAYIDYGPEHIESLIKDILKQPDALGAMHKDAVLSKALDRMKSRKELAAPIRELLGPVDVASVTIPQTLAHQQWLLWNNDVWNKVISVDPNLVSPIQRTGFSIEVPNDPIRYGDAAGKFLADSAADLVDLARSNIDVGPVLGFFKGVGKFAKLNQIVLGRMTTWMTNAFGNPWFALLSGGLDPFFRPRETGRAWGLAFDIITHGQFGDHPYTFKQNIGSVLDKKTFNSMKGEKNLDLKAAILLEARRHGVDEPGLAGVEIGGKKNARLLRMVQTELSKAHQGASYWERMNIVGKVLSGANATLEELMAAYDSIDRTFKLASYISLREKGLRKFDGDVEKAASWAAERVLDSFPSYQNMGKAVEVMGAAPVIFNNYVRFATENIRTTGMIPMRAFGIGREAELDLLPRLLMAYGAVATMGSALAVARREMGISDEEAEELINNRTTHDKAWRPLVFVMPYRKPENNEPLVIDLTPFWAPAKLFYGMPQNHPAANFALALLNSATENSLTGMGVQKLAEASGVTPPEYDVLPPEAQRDAWTTAKALMMANGLPQVGVGAWQLMQKGGHGSPVGAPVDPETGQPLMSRYSEPYTLTDQILRLTGTPAVPYSRPETSGISPGYAAAQFEGLFAGVKDIPKEIRTIAKNPKLTMAEKQELAAETPNTPRKMFHREDINKRAGGDEQPKMPKNRVFRRMKK